MEMKNRSHWIDQYIKRFSSRNGHKYSKYKKCLNIMALIWFKVDLETLATV